jgi:DNA adenine methylase
MAKIGKLFDETPKVIKGGKLTPEELRERRNEQSRAKRARDKAKKAGVPPPAPPPAPAPPPPPPKEEIKLSIEEIKPPPKAKRTKMTPEELKARRNEQTRKYRAAKKASEPAQAPTPPTPEKLIPPQPTSPTSVVDAPYGYTASGRIRKKPIKESTERRDRMPSRSAALQQKVEDERIKKYTESSVKFRQFKMTPAEKKADLDYLAKIRGEDDPLIIKLRESYKPIEPIEKKPSGLQLNSYEKAVVDLMYPSYSLKIGTGKNDIKLVDLGGSIPKDSEMSGSEPEKYDYFKDRLFLINRLRYKNPDEYILPYYTDIVESSFPDKIKITYYNSTSDGDKMIGNYETRNVLLHRSGYMLDPANTNKVLGFWFPEEDKQVSSASIFGTVNNTYYFPQYYSQQWLDGTKTLKKWIDFTFPLHNYEWQDPDGNVVERSKYARTNNSLFTAYQKIVDEYKLIFDADGMTIPDDKNAPLGDETYEKYEAYEKKVGSVLEEWFIQLYAMLKKRKVVFCEDKIQMFRHLLYEKGMARYSNNTFRGYTFQREIERADKIQQWFNIKHGVYLYADYFLNLQSPPDYITGQTAIKYLPTIFNLWLRVDSQRRAERFVDKIYREFGKEFAYDYRGGHFIKSSYSHIQDLFFDSNNGFASKLLKDEEVLDWFATPEGAERDAKKAGVFNEYMIDNEKKGSWEPRDINRDALLEWIELPDGGSKQSEVLVQGIYNYLKPKIKEPVVSGKGLYEDWHAMPAGADKDAKAKELFGLVKGGKIPTTPEELQGAVDHGSPNLRPPFCRNGNKYPVKDILVKQFPEHKKYVEPFTGSSALFFNKAKAEQNVLNDLDKRMIQSLRWLKSAPSKGDPEWDKIEFKGKPYISQYKGDMRDDRYSGDRVANARAFFAKVPNSIIEKMAHFKLAGCAGFNGVFANKPSQIYKVSEKPLQRIETYLDLYKEYLKGVSLETKDYANIIKQHDGADTFFFIDPPYENTSSSLGYAEDKGFDFQRLRETLEKVKGKFLMTLNDSPNIRKIFQQFKINGFSAPNTWNTLKDKADRKPRKEVTIRNY